MAINTVTNTTTTDLTGGVPNFQIQANSIDDNQDQKEFYYYNQDWNQHYSYFVEIPEVYQSITSINMWAFGKGYKCDTRTKVILEHITGWGEDTFDSIMMNLGQVEDVNGDAYAEIIRDDDTGILINLKPLNPEKVRHVVNKQGLIERYDVYQNGEWKKMDKSKMFHICNGRIANQIHGISKIKSLKWLVDAKKEAMEDWRRISHRSTIRVLYIDVEDSSKLTTVKTQYKDAIKNGEVLVLPLIKGQEAQFEDITAPPVAQFLSWIQYIDSQIMRASGVPDIIMGGTQTVGEANSKMGYLTFEVPYSVKARQMEQDLWNQLQIKVEFEKPASLMDYKEEADNSNAGQMGIQPNETGISIGRTE